MKKNLLGMIAFGLLVLTFIAPWLWIDNGEDIVESFYREHSSDLQNFKRLKNRDTCGCDGSCLNVQWVPFGVKVDNCSKDYFFISFWGQRFYMNGE